MVGVRRYNNPVESAERRELAVRFAAGAGIALACFCALFVAVAFAMPIFLRPWPVWTKAPIFFVPVLSAELLRRRRKRDRHPHR
jgi:hypothetical protein